MNNNIFASNADVVGIHKIQGNNSRKTFLPFLLIIYFLFFSVLLRTIELNQRIQLIYWTSKYETLR